MNDAKERQMRNHEQARTYWRDVEETGRQRAQVAQRHVRAEEQEIRRDRLAVRRPTRNRAG